MRNYPRNSPQAAARILALSLLADGHLCRSEAATLEHDYVAGALGLDPLAAAGVLQHLVEDLLASGASTWSGTGSLDEALVLAILQDVDEPVLRRRLLALCTAAAQADGHLSEGEAAFLDLAARHWGLGAPATA